tara:strand:- start:1062 stop:2000 length:939 start_codon:yes stop_codon:yes gene_type:complete
MRLDPLNIVLDQDIKGLKRFYFISGNEKTLIEKIITKIIEKYKVNENTTITNIDTIKGYVEEGGLFENKRIILVKNCKEIKEQTLKQLDNTSDVFIFAQENSQKIKKIKNIFLKDKNSYLIDCYELDKNSKVRVVNEFIKISGKNLDEDLYWFLVEKLNNKYAFLENTLNIILGLDDKDINLYNVKKLLTANITGKEKVFFSLFKKNREIIEIYREKVTSTSDVNEFYYYLKSFCQLIIDSKNEEEYNKRIPVYLFREKNFLIDVYRKYNSKKKKSLLTLLSTTEKMLRKESNLSLISGLRFLLSIKKITIS